MNRLLKSLVGLIIGAICGALVGAAIIAIPTYRSTRCGPLGCERDWTVIGIALGAILGGVPGAIVGLVVGVASPNKAISAAIGAFTGSIITLVVFGMGAADDPMVSVWAILAIPAGALVGLIASVAVGLVRIRSSKQSLGDLTAE
jgi:CDP-diglyceride synthetase